ncbi:MAG: flippase [Lachnospiraceae bacterium]
MSKNIKVNSLLSVIQKTCNILFPLLVFPYLSHVLGPDGFGKYSFANSINCYFLLAAMLGIQTYAVREGARVRDNKEEMNRFVSEIFSINLLSLVLTGMVFAAFILWHPGFVENRQLLLILSVILPCTVFGRDYINAIYEDYAYITIRYIIIQVLGIAAIFLFVRTESDYVIYTVIYMVTTSAGYLVNFFYTRKYVSFRITTHMNMKRHLKPIMILFCGQIATTIYLQSDVTMLGVYKDDVVVGIYSVAAKIYGLSKSVINAITTAIIPRLVFYLGKKDEEGFRHMSNRLAEYLLLFVIPVMTGLFVLSEPVLYIVGGEKFLAGSLTLKILSIALLFAVMSGFYCNAIMIPLRKEKEYLYITIASAALNIGLNFVMIPRFGMAGAALTTLLSEILVMMLAILRTRNELRTTMSFRHIGSILVGSGAIAAVCYFTDCFVKNYYLSFTVAFVASIMVYSLVLCLLGNAIALSVFQKIFGKFTKKQ